MQVLKNNERAIDSITVITRFARNFNKIIKYYH